MIQLQIGMRPFARSLAESDPLRRFQRSPLSTRYAKRLIASIDFTPFYGRVALQTDRPPFPQIEYKIDDHRQDYRAACRNIDGAVAE